MDFTRNNQRNNYLKEIDKIQTSNSTLEAGGVGIFSCPSDLQCTTFIALAVGVVSGNHHARAELRRQQPPRPRS